MNPNNYFAVTAKIKREIDNGKVKTYTERYVVNAVSVTDAESVVYAYLEGEGETEFSIAAASQTKIAAVLG